MSPRSFKWRTSSAEIVTFSTDADGLCQVLGPLEALVIQALWDLPEPVTMIDMMDYVHRQAPTLAQSTIQTTVNRLTEKGLAQKTSVDGQDTRQAGYTYRAAYDPPALARHVIGLLYPALERFAASYGVYVETREKGMRV